MTVHQLGPCELCGADGSCIVTDVQEIEPEDGFRRWKVHSRHTLCDTHVRPAIRYPSEEAR